MKFAGGECAKKHLKHNTMHFWIAGILFLVWFFGYMFFNAEKEIHFVFLTAVLVLVIKIIKDYKGNN